MSGNAAVDADALRAEVRSKYREVAIDPHGTYHFHTGRGLAARLGYDDATVASLPDVAVESFAGVANPFSLRPLASGERVVDVGAGAGFDAFVAALIKIAEEAKTQPELLHNAPSTTQFGRMDEVKAARELVLCCWLPDGYDLNA